MEFLQGRALSNAIGNLDIKDAYADALNKLGHELEEIVEQVISFFALHLCCRGTPDEIKCHVLIPM